MSRYTDRSYTVLRGVIEVRDATGTTIFGYLTEQSNAQHHRFGVGGINQAVSSFTVALDPDNNPIFQTNIGSMGLQFISLPI